MAVFREIEDIIKTLQRALKSSQTVNISVAARAAEQFLKTLEDNMYVRILKTQRNHYKVEINEMFQIHIGHNKPIKYKKIHQYASKVLPTITGAVVVSTPRGVMTHEEAERTRTGGRVIALVY